MPKVKNVLEFEEQIRNVVTVYCFAEFYV